MLVKDTSIYYTVAVNLIRRQEAKRAQLCTGLARKLDDFGRGNTDAVLNSNTHEAIVVRVDDGGQVLPTVSKTVAATYARFSGEKCTNLGLE